MRTIVMSLSFFMFLACNPLSAQNYIHSLGFSFQMIKPQPLEYLYFSNTRPPFYRRHQEEAKIYFPVSYHLRRKLFAQKSIPLDFSVDLPLEIALYWSTDSDGINHFINAHIPLHFSVNYGAYSFSEAKSTLPLGYFLGVGYALQYTRGNLGKRNILLPSMTGGIRIKLNENHGLELAYSKNLFFKLKRTNSSGDPFFATDWYERSDVALQNQYFSIRYIFKMKSGQ